MKLTKSKIVFLDTNVYLHYQLFDQINWLEVLKAEDITIIVPPVIIRELNKHKDSHSRPRVKKRADVILKKLFTLFDADSKVLLRDGIEILLEDRDPLIDFDTHQLNRDVQDDVLIGNIIMCRTEVPETEIVLVTSDFGLTLSAKARRQGIATFKIPDNFKIPDEPNPEQQRIKELEKEIRELQLRIPQLSLMFEDGSNYANFTVSPPFELTADEIEDKLKTVRDRYPKMDKQPKPPAEGGKENNSTLTGIAAAIAAMQLNHISSKAIAEYNEELENFYREYEQFLQDDVLYSNFMRRTIKLAILLVNDGTAPAEDIDIFMHFPDGFRLFDEDNFPNRPTEPQPPSKPKSTLEMFGSMRESLIVPSYLSNLTPYHAGSISPPSNVSSMNIRRTNSYDVDFHVRRLKHQMQEPADILYVVFDSFEEVKSFQIDYKILAADVPNEIDGSLHVVIEKTNSSTETAA